MEDKLQENEGEIRRKSLSKSGVKESETEGLGIDDRKVYEASRGM